MLHRPPGSFPCSPDRPICDVRLCSMTSSLELTTVTRPRTCCQLGPPLHVDLNVGVMMSLLDHTRMSFNLPDFAAMSKMAACVPSFAR